MKLVQANEPIQWFEQLKYRPRIYGFVRNILVFVIRDNPDANKEEKKDGLLTVAHPEPFLLHDLFNGGTTYVDSYLHGKAAAFEALHDMVDKPFELNIDCRT